MKKFCTNIDDISPQAAKILVEDIMRQTNISCFEDIEALITSGEWLGASTSESAQMGKFCPLVSLGTITVAEGDDHATRMARFVAFYEQNKDLFNYYNFDVNDGNFSNPSYVMEPGKTILVKTFQQIVKGPTTTEERMDYLDSLGAVYPGAQAIPPVFEQKRDILPKGFWYASYDRPERLWKGTEVPTLNARTDGRFCLRVGGVNEVWFRSYAFFGFFEVTEGIRSRQFSEHQIPRIAD
jgi:hypothetical protein